MTRCMSGLDDDGEEDLGVAGVTADGEAAGSFMMGNVLAGVARVYGGQRLVRRRYNSNRPPAASKASQQLFGSGTADVWLIELCSCSEWTPPSSTTEPCAANEASIRA